MRTRLRDVKKGALFKVADSNAIWRKDHYSPSWKMWRCYDEDNETHCRLLRPDTWVERL